AIPAYAVCSRLRLESADSPQHSAESGSLSYGPPVRLRLLSTSPHGDAVTFDYEVMACLDADLHRADVMPSRAHGLRPGAGATKVGIQPSCRQSSRCVFLATAAPEPHGHPCDHASRCARAQSVLIVRNIFLVRQIAPLNPGNRLRARDRERGARGEERATIDFA